MARLPRKTDAARGVLDGAARLDPARGRAIQLQRFVPPGDLERFVEHFWIVAWDLRAEGPRTQETLPHPSVHWVIEGARSEILGIERGKFERVLEWAGRVVAVKFRPGGFCAFTTQPMHTLTGRRIPASELLGAKTRGLATAIRRAGDDDAVLRWCEVLRALAPERDEAAERAGAMVEVIAKSPELVSVAQVAERFAVAPLALQRLFRRKIGVTPKWVIQRYRLHEALERIHASRRSRSDAGVRPRETWAALAADLGFTDQAHFARAFKEHVGVSPGRYAARLRD